MEYIDHKGLKYHINQQEFNMKQHQWLDVLKDYDLEVTYHHGKVNVFAYVLNQMKRGAPFQVTYLTMTHGTSLFLYDKTISG